MARLEGRGGILSGPLAGSETTRGMGMRYLSLAGFLFAFWVALSGHYTSMLVAAGAVSAVVCVLAAIRMRVADAEGHPIELLWGASPISRG